MIERSPDVKAYDHAVELSIEARKPSRDQALRIWHTTPSIKVLFEDYWAELVREGKA